MPHPLVSIMKLDTVFAIILSHVVFYINLLKCLHPMRVKMGWQEEEEKVLRGRN